MNNIPTELKKLLFGKDESECLNAEEQHAWEASLIDVQPFPIALAIFDSGYEALTRLHDQKKAAWQKFKKDVLKKNR